MFSHYFFEKLAQAYFCDGTIHVSGGVSFPYYFWPCNKKQTNKQNLSQGEYFKYGNIYKIEELQSCGTSDLIFSQLEQNCVRWLYHVWTNQKELQILAFLHTCIIPLFPWKA